jgi:hypothetical protein
MDSKIILAEALLVFISSAIAFTLFTLGYSMKEQRSPSLTSRNTPEVPCKD